MSIENRGICRTELDLAVLDIPTQENLVDGLKPRLQSHSYVPSKSTQFVVWSSHKSDFVAHSLISKIVARSLLTIMQYWDNRTSKNFLKLDKLSLDIKTCLLFISFYE